MSRALGSPSRELPRRVSALLALACLGLATCNEDTSLSPFRTGSVALAVTGSPVTMMQGQNGSVTITITRVAPFTGPVTLSAEGLSAGMTAAFSPPTIPSSGTSSALTLTSASTVAAGTYPVTVRVKGQGIPDATVAVSAVVTAAPAASFSLSLTPTTLGVAPGGTASTAATITRSGGFSGPITLAVTGAPSGVTTTVSPSPVTAGSAVIDVAANASTALGTYTLTITGTGTGVTQQSATLALTVSATPTPTIAVALSPTALSVAPGATGTSTATVSRGGGFTGPVTLAITGAPTGVTATITPNPIADETAAIAIAVGATATPGSSTLTVTATGTGVTTQTATIDLTIPSASTGSFSVALAPTSVSVAQGASGTSTATVTRAGGFTGPVTFAVSGAPAGVTASVTTTPTTDATATVTLAVAASTAPGTYALTLTGTGSGVAAQSSTLSLTVTAATAPSFSLALAPSSLNVTQGASATSTATIARAGGFAAAVALTVTGAPSGMAVTVTPASVTGTTATIEIAPTTAVAAGSYTLTIQGTGTGVTTQSTTLTVQVAAASTTSGTYAFCADNAPTWFAVQDGNGPWTRVTASAANSYSFSFASGRGGIAYVTNSSGGADLTVLFATAAELAGSGTTNVACTIGGKTVNGSVAGVAATDFATIALASSTAQVIGAGAHTFQLEGVPSGAHDLIASRAEQTMSGSDYLLVVNRLIIRRGLDPADGSTIPVLDFAASESFAPATADVTINNLGGDEASSAVSLNTANGTSSSFYFSIPSTASTRPYFDVTDAQLAGGDLHSLLVFASAPSDETSVRLASVYLRSVANRSVTLGPAIGAPTITTVASSPYLRLRAQLPLQGEYDRFGGVTYSQSSGRETSVFMTGAYAGSGPFDLTIPDLSAVSGWNNAWGLQPGVSTEWSVFESGGTFMSGFPGATPTEGATVISASRSGTISSP